MNRKTVYEISKTEPREVEILHMRPEGSTAPKTLAWVQYLPGKGMDVTMICYETRPRAIYWDPNGAIYTDSCMACVFCEDNELRHRVAACSFSAPVCGTLRRFSSSRAYT